ncbi:hypothetical protein COU54_00170 [Candidatus Pacearchaeota archaeon CG10_big_fil_rev_8_21_14_0_10_31_24]|nr:MAG: hypothetical protein COU54_00170 [Candidatus Pacearchaeota archaeon CG10_big_fil_rev_8_21_14_0_10_31_24]
MSFEEYFRKEYEEIQIRYSSVAERYQCFRGLFRRRFDEGDLKIINQSLKRVRVLTFKLNESALNGFSSDFKRELFSKLTGLELEMVELKSKFF